MACKAKAPQKARNEALSRRLCRKQPSVAHRMHPFRLWAEPLHPEPHGLGLTNDWRALVYSAQAGNTEA